MFHRFFKEKTGFFIGMIIIWVFARCAYGFDISKHQFRNGDVLFQHQPSELADVISKVTGSRYSHCGIIVIINGEIQVIEAAGTVIYTPVGRWIERGVGGAFSQYRPVGLTPVQIKKAICEAEKLLGRPYDILYRMDDEKIYCSELVYKAFLRGCNIRVGKPQALGTLNWEPHEAFIRNITGGELPLHRMMVTPESLTHSGYLKLIYSNYK